MREFTGHKVMGLSLGVALAAAAMTALPAMAASDGNMAHAHMGHVSTQWNDTPDGKGLLPTAMAEAKIAAQHAGFAADKTGDLGWMQTHVRHVLNAIDPSLEAKGPGLGYGVIKAASGTAKHIGFAAKSEGASENVITHAPHVSTSAENTVARAKTISTLGAQVLAAGDAGTAAPLVQEIATLAGQLVAGVDANGDGTISWEKGEGGLRAAAKHMSIMAKGEGMN